MATALPNPRFVGTSTLGQSTPKTVTVGLTSTLLLAASPNRVFAKVINNSSQRIYIQYGIAAVMGRGQPLSPGNTLTVSADELWLGQINAITITASVDIDVIEGV